MFGIGFSAFGGMVQTMALTSISLQRAPAISLRRAPVISRTLMKLPNGKPNVAVALHSALISASFNVRCRGLAIRPRALGFKRSIGNFSRSNRSAAC